MSDDKPRKSRRMFIVDMVGIGAALLGSVAWGWGSRPGPTTGSPTPTRPTPVETDHMRAPGDMVAPPRPSSTPSGVHTCAPTPGEHDRIQPAGGIAPPPATPRATPATPKPTPKHT